MKSKLALLALCVICSFAINAQNQEMQVSDSLEVEIESDLIEYARHFIGTPYGNKGTDTSSFDCSGYVMHVYGKQGVLLPHGSSTQSQVCKKIKLTEVETGDLLFFSGRKKSKKNIGHVAIVVSNDHGRVVMIHATVHAGVIEETLQNSAYFMPRFIMAGRIKTIETKK